MRLTVVVDRFPELSETFITSELQEIRRLGHAVRVEAGTRAGTPNLEAAAGIETAFLDVDSREARIASLAWLVGRHPLGCLRDLLARRRWARDEPVRPLRQLAPAARRISRARSEHLHAHFAAQAALDAMRLARLLGIPYSLATHGYDIFESPANLREKHARAAFAVTACDYSAEHLRQVLGETIGARIHTVVMGVDGERFRRREPHPDGRTVVAVARLVEKKGLRHLIEAAAILRERGREIRVLIAGDGPLSEQLAECAARLGLERAVTLVGPQSPDAVRELLEGADLLAMPCIVAANGDRDTMPVVVKEALAMEVPVVASDEVGLPEIVEPGWGRLVPPGDSAALADAIDELLSLPRDQRIEMGRAGRARVLERCSVAGETERLLRLIDSARRG